MLGGSGPRLLREDDGCWGGVGVGHQSRAPGGRAQSEGVVLCLAGWQGQRCGEKGRDDADHAGSRSGSFIADMQEESPCSTKI